MSETEQNHKEQVRRRAYELWEQAGRPDGQHDEFWHKAQAELKSPSDDVNAPSDHQPEKIDRLTASDQVAPTRNQSRAA